MSEKKSFMIYMDWEAIVEALDSNEQAGELFKALFAFAKRGETPHLEGALNMAFIMMSSQMTRDKARWEETCRKRSEAGKKSGESRANKNTDSSSVRANACFAEQNEQKEQKEQKEQNEQNEQNEQKGTKRTDKDTDKDKDTETDKDTDTGEDKDTDMDMGEGTDTGTEPALTRGSMPPAAAAPSPSPRYTKKNKSKEKPRISEESILGGMRAEYGTALTEQYLRKVEDYCASTGKDYANKAAAARKWLREDVQKGKVVPPSKSSFCTDRFYSAANEFDPWEELKRLEAGDEELKRLGVSNEEPKSNGVSDEDMIRLKRASYGLGIV